MLWLIIEPLNHLHQQICLAIVGQSGLMRGWSIQMREYIQMFGQSELLLQYYFLFVREA